MERLHIPETADLFGHDVLAATRQSIPPRDEWSFAPNRAYDAYHRIHKVFVGEVGGQRLEEISNALSKEWMPRYLNAAGWAAAEAALVQDNTATLHRMNLLDQAADCWQRALVAQEQLHQSEQHEWARENSAPYRYALNLAFVPLMKALSAGTITEATLERTFADTLAIAQTATIQRHLAHTEGNYDASGDLLGFGHECNALLTLLYMNDPRHIPLPSTARAGTGYEHSDQTHDITVINQHWGTILKVIPVEVKSRASRRDRRRYKALIVRGKLHLSIEGKYLPEHTHDAFANVYEGKGGASDYATIHHATTTMIELLRLYQQGKRLHGDRKGATLTHFYEKTPK
jgi:hypothetical protein